VALQDEILLFKERLSIRPLLRYQFVDSNFGAQPGFGSIPLDTPRDDQEHLFSPSLGVKYRSSRTSKATSDNSNACQRS
jgi:hypothetical protein